MCRPCGGWCCHNRLDSEEADPRAEGGCGCEDCPEEACWPDDQTVETYVRRARRWRDAMTEDAARRPPVRRREIEIVGRI